MGGEIDVDTAPGRGATFSFTLPLEPGDYEESADLDAFGLVAGQRTLIVTPEVAMRRALQRQLAHWGAAVTGVADSHAALAALRDAQLAHAPPFDTILIDATSTHDGEALRTLVRSAREHLRSERSVVVLTPKGHPDIADPGAECPDVTSLLVPVREADLLHVLSGRHRTSGKQLAAAEPPPTMQRVTAKVLLVEDNPVNQMVGTASLKALGAQVAVANDGLEALEALEHDRFDIVLMDCQMPHMDGFEALATIRARERNQAPGTRSDRRNALRVVRPRRTVERSPGQDRAQGPDHAAPRCVRRPRRSHCPTDSPTMIPADAGQA
jgi:CheY-like chemotaxis protein